MTGNQLSELLIVISPKMPRKSSKIKQKLSRFFKFVITLVNLAKLKDQTSIVLVFSHPDRCNFLAKPQY